MIPSDAGVEVRLLGRFEVAVDSRPVPAQAWEHRRAADLVKLLALSPEHRLTRDEVIEALWPQLSATAGVANLHKAAHYARRALGWPESIVLRRGVVALAPGHRVQTDVELLGEGGGPDGDVADLLPEDRYEEWTAAHRDRLAEVRAEALRRQSRWEDLLRIEPADEEISRVVMRERAARGRSRRRGAPVPAPARGAGQARPDTVRRDPVPLPGDRRRGPGSGAGAIA